MEKLLNGAAGTAASISVAKCQRPERPLSKMQDFGSLNIRKCHAINVAWLGILFAPR